MGYYHLLEMSFSIPSLCLCLYGKGTLYKVVYFWILFSYLFSHSVFFFLIYLFVFYLGGSLLLHGLSLVVVGESGREGCGAGLLFVAVYGLLVAVASLAAEHQL